MKSQAEEEFMRLIRPLCERRGLAPEREILVVVADEIRFQLDVFFRSRNLAVEIDGASHDGRADADALRDHVLLGVGIRTIRFSNTDVLYRGHSVVRRLARALDAADPQPTAKSAPEFVSAPAHERGRSRGSRMPPSRKRYRAAYYAKLAFAPAHLAPWDDEERRAVVAHAVPDRQLAARFGRSIAAIQVMRSLMKSGRKKSPK